MWIVVNWVVRILVVAHPCNLATSRLEKIHILVVNGYSVVSNIKPIVLLTATAYNLKFNEHANILRKNCQNFKIKSKINLEIFLIALFCSLAVLSIYKEYFYKLSTDRCILSVD